MEDNKTQGKLNKEENPKELDWLEENFDGQLAVDVYQTDKDIIIKSTIAGVRVEEIDISLHNDMLTIKGLRHKDEEIAPEDYFYQECYWGGFSRSIILPVEVKEEEITATLRNGILTIILPKAEKTKLKAVKVKEEEE